MRKGRAMPQSPPHLITTAALAFALCLGFAPGALATAEATLGTSQLDGAGLRQLASGSWSTYRTAAGPTIRVSPAYGNATAIADRWSSFFELLVHGSELSLLNAYIAPIDEVRQICGGSDVLGCYGDDHLVMPDQGSDGISSTSIATHEYGHHVAFNRVNPPWTAIDWGPKRWATYERVCARATTGTAYPGAEDANYALNPGEAWAETYRVLNETAAGLPPTWPIVDPSFQPDADALAAAREDVLNPWTAPTTSVQSVRFGKNARAWDMKLTAPVDGTLHVQVQPGSDDVMLLAGDKRTSIAHGTWNSSGGKAFDYVVCGQRSFTLRVSRNASARRFTLRLSIP
jgi:hypothetical protein